MWAWLRSKWRENVEVERVDHYDWDYVASATRPVRRHRGCGDLVPEEFMLAHMKEKHGAVTVAQISLLSDGGTDAIAPTGFTLSMGQVLGLLKFIEVHLSPELKRDFGGVDLGARIDNLRRGPWPVH